MGNGYVCLDGVIDGRWFYSSLPIDVASVAVPLRTVAPKVPACTTQTCQRSWEWLVECSGALQTIPSMETWNIVTEYKSLRDSIFPRV
jgi:hypothetical protein